jgi:pyrimidine-nucleoside phosphorylase
MKFIVSELIRKKRIGSEHTSEEIRFLVESFSKNKIPDYQIAAWLMACFVKPLTADEIFLLTEAMKNSGQVLEWESLLNAQSYELVDKHSTGGVGDKVSLVLAPLVAEMGLKVPMMAGRGLGFTGGTVDKLESLKGFQMDLSVDLQKKCIQDAGFVMLKQSEQLCPADKKLYALRDVTGTVENIGLITASIVSKKWAAGVRNILFDVKCGTAAFMPDLQNAQWLAKSLVDVSKKARMNARALITRMDEPLGSCVGNGVEVMESVWILKNQFPSPELKKLASSLIDLICLQAAHMYQLCFPNTQLQNNLSRANEILESGKAYHRFLKMIQNQNLMSEKSAEYGQDVLEKLIDQIDKTPRIKIKSEQAGYLSEIQSRDLGLIGIELRIGRERETDSVDPVAGFILNTTVGSRIEKGSTLCEVSQGNTLVTQDQISKIQKCFKVISAEAPAHRQEQLWLETIE